MTALLQLLASTLAGAVLGLVFFGGLWLTVRRLDRLDRAALWLPLGFIVRFACVLGGFYLLAAHGGWQQVIAAMIGFVLVRIVLIRRLRGDQTSEESTS